MMPNRSLRLLRSLLCLQLGVFLWFIFSPDGLPEILKSAERQISQGNSDIVDLCLIGTNYLQAFVCLLLFFPQRFSAFFYLILVGVTSVLGLFSGPAMLSSLDAFFGYLQALSTGAVLVLLWLYEIFNTKRVSFD